MIGRLAFGLFLLSSAADLAGVFAGWHILALCSKPLIVPSLALCCWTWLKENGVKGRKVSSLMLALAFGALGDILLMFDGQNFFIAGLLAFLVGHFFYISTIGAKLPGKVSVLMPQVLLLAVLIFVMIAASRFFAVKGFLGVCVSLYACAFAFCLHSAILAAASTKSRHYVWTAVGYLLFIISDTILATGEFTDIRIPKRGFLVMLTYILAQFLLATSLSREEIRKHNAINSAAN